MYTCACCGLAVAANESVWFAGATGLAMAGDEGLPYHVSCAPGKAVPDIEDGEIVEVVEIGEGGLPYLRSSTWGDARNGRGTYVYHNSRLVWITPKK